MRDFLSFTAILAIALATTFAGFILWVPLVGTVALCATSHVWSMAPRIARAGLAGEVIPLYLQSIANAAMAIGGATALGLVAKMVFFS